MVVRKINNSLHVPLTFTGLHLISPLLDKICSKLHLISPMTENFCTILHLFYSTLHLFSLASDKIRTKFHLFSPVSENFRTKFHLNRSKIHLFSPASEKISTKLHPKAPLTDKIGAKFHLISPPSTLHVSIMCLFASNLHHLAPKMFPPPAHPMFLRKGEEAGRALAGPGPGFYLLRHEDYLCLCEW
jgi:hypothetical protein